MKRSRRARFWIVYLLGCAAATLGLLELGVRLFVPAARFFPIQNIYARAPEPGLEYTLKPSFTGTAFNAPLRTNAQGFRGPEWTVEKPPGTFRIALVGDSHAFGYGLPYESSMGPQLARALDGAGGKRVEALVFAAPGYNARQELALVEQRVLRFAPDLIVVVTTANDDDDAYTVDDEGYVWRERNIRVLDGAIEPAQHAPSWLMRHSRLYLYVRLGIERRRFARENAARHAAIPPANEPWMAPLEGTEPLEPRLIATVKQPLARLIAAAKARGVPVLLAPLVCSGNWRQLTHELAREGPAGLVEVLAEFPEVTDYTDLLGKFSLGWDTHLNAEAHRRIAGAMARAIRERYLH